ncbi:uncharacterized protein F4822DRAFT_401841 [Hypoxylon trugodes]|uniref:uncharacterized protein n=1 Tax=Hypoxylon trugodes TaxID=326681 RepID=UPI00219794B1|nr:uncharacterized protein F4822DRAFT_401841 [Hypoxylon trugodes]KAI1390406.1 hypothetical protein F4822DRAFT_401841 [Hypoxylon trugodes]
MTPVYPIEGISVEPGQPLPVRRDCNEWAKDHENNIQVSLFIRALQKLYDLPYDQDLSFSRIAGIHGFPANVPWNDANPPANIQGGTTGIYCVHNQITFPTWHRVYMLLFEQRIHELMLEVISTDLTFNSAEEKKAWIKEANQFRLPYFNWARPKNFEIPHIYTINNIKIRVPKSHDGSNIPPELIENPLYRFQLRVGGKLTKMGDLPKPYTIEDTSGFPWSKCSGTSRWGIVENTPESKWSQGINNWPKANAAISSHTWEDPNDKTDINNHTASELVYRILSSSYCKNFSSFASTAAQPEQINVWTEYLSLEYVHNGLHDFIGGSSLKDGAGHMSNVPVAAFDPIFYMHHCFIDLLFAIRQTLYPDQWFTENDNPKAGDNLPPFRHESEPGEFNYYNSDLTRNWRKYGYDYDITSLENGRNQEYLDRIREHIDGYMNTGQLLMKHRHGTRTPDIPFDKHDDYIINVIYDRHALGGDPYTIHFYLGDVAGHEPLSPSLHPHHVGSVSTFSFRAQREGTVHCGSCVQQAEKGVLSTAQVPLTIALHKIASNPSIPGLSEISPNVVETYLRDNLRWRAISSSGIEINVDRLPRTRIFMLKGEGTHFPSRSKMSEYSNYTAMSSVTHNRPWGANHSDY